jgi:hypothetical protein
MRLKILAAVVFGVAAVVLVPISANTPAGGAFVAQLQARTGTATAARMQKPTPTPTPAATPTAAPAPAATDCTIIVPANPLTAQGLATPYQLTQAKGAPKCSETDDGVSAFVQGAVLDPATGKIGIYNPLVVDRGSRPAVAPTVPTLPANAVVALWFGYNGGTLTLAGPGARHCVSGIPGSQFGQVSYCNAPAFFQQANALIKAGKITVPALGTAKDGRTCPTVRDFSVVDQDPSDNVTARYLADANGRTAQNTPANVQKMGAGATLSNGSDNALLAIRLAKALGCTPWMAPDLADTSATPQMLTAQPLNELQAAAHQAAPQALIPTLDPMVLVDGHRSVAKINAYRAGVDQPMINSFSDAFTGPYCRNMLNLGLPRVAMDRPLTSAQPSPDPGAASNLFTFLAMRFQASFSADDGFLKCTRLLHMHNPVTLKTDANGVVVDASFNIKAPPLSPTVTVPAANAAMVQDPGAVPANEDVALVAKDVTPADAAAKPAAAMMQKDVAPA